MVVRALSYWKQRVTWEERQPWIYAHHIEKASRMLDGDNFSTQQTLGDQAWRMTNATAERKMERLPVAYKWILCKRSLHMLSFRREG